MNFFESVLKSMPQTASELMQWVSLSAFFFFGSQELTIGPIDLG